jgi:hypothetical protein
VAARVRWTGTTTSRGYGSPHQSERERRLAQYRPGDLCAHGGEPMWWPMPMARQYLHLPHNAARTGYLPGLSCAQHNLSEGASRGNRMRGSTQRSGTRAWRTSRQW